MSDTLTYLVGNRWTKDAEGEFISVEDSHAVPPVSLSVDGKSTQVTTTGKNLLDHNVSNWLRVSGFSTIPGLRNVWPIAADDGEIFTYSRNGTGTLGMFLHWCNDPTDVSTYSDTIVTLTNRGNYTVTNSEGYAYLVMDGSTTITTETMDTRQAQIEKGASYTPYEPYSGGAASPRPDWPQEIVSVDGPSVKITAKNLLGGDDFRYSLSRNSAITFGEDEHGRYARWSAGTDSINLVKGVHFKENTPYTFIFAVNCTREARPWNITGYYTDKAAIDLKPVEAFDGTTIQVFAITTSASKTVEGIYRVNNGGATYLYYDQCGVFEGIITVDDYAAYLGHTVQLLPDGYSLRSLPNGTKDELHLAYLRPSDRPGWAWYSRELTENVVELDLGDLTWYVAVQTDGYVRARCPLSTIPPNWFTKNAYMCSAYKTANARGGSTLLDVNTICTYATNHAIFVKDARWTSETTAAEVKEDLTGVKFHYAPSTPQIITLDPIELPATQSGLTNIWSDPSTKLSITYERDRNIVISNLKATINDLATS